MPKVQEKIPENLRVYNFHGVNLEWNDSSEQAVGDCPFCGRDGKFSVLIETGVWRCLVCNEGSDKGKPIQGGNQYIFIRKLHEMSYDATQPSDYEELAKDRRLQPMTLLAWNVCKSIINGDWLLPGYSPDGKLNQLYRYIGSPKRKLIPTPTLGHQLHYQSYDPSKGETHILEGPWDGMAWWETLREAKFQGDTLVSTGNEAGSLLANVNVIAAPGCETFKEEWLCLLTDKDNTWLYDSDHPREHNGRSIPSAGFTGLSRVAGLAARNASPKSLNYLKWGENGFDLTKPSGYDVRDHLTRDLTAPASRLTRLGELLGLITPFPVEELKTQANGVKSNGNPGKELTPLKCKDYKTLQNAWRKAMKWGDGLDCALATMLSCVASTMQVGDQLWVKVMSPPSCLDGDTLVYDPVTDLRLSVKERFELGKEFHVYSKSENGEITIRKAEVPHVYPKAEMFEVQFESGKILRVTGGHRFWTGVSYVALHTIVDELRSSSSYPLPSISELDLSTHRQDALRCWRTTQDCQCDCCVYSCPRDEQPQPLSNSDQYGVPLQVDVQQRSHDYSCLDGLQPLDKRNHPLTDSDPLSSCSVSPQRKYTPESQHRERTKRNEPYHDKSSSALQHDQLESRLHRERQPLAASLHPTIDDESQPYVLSETPTQEQYQYESDLHKPLTSFLGDNTEQLATSTDVALMEPSDVSLLCEVQRQLPSKLFAEVSDLSSKSDRSRQRSCLACREQQLDPYVPEKLVAFDTPVKVKTVVLTLTEVDAIVKVSPIGKRVYYDFHVPETENYLVEGMIHHNTGKTSLVEGLMVARKYVKAPDTLRGFTSGYKTEDGSTCDLATDLDGMTLVTVDGDTLLQLPNLPGILSESRRLYDGTLQSHFKNKTGKSVESHRMTWLLCGTGSLRKLDSSELGARFLDCVIMDKIDEDLEDEILLRMAHKSSNNVSRTVDVDDASSQKDAATIEAMRLTGGYVIYLRENAEDMISAVSMGDDEHLKCAKFGKLIAFMRARPSKTQEEVQEREMGSRLVSQVVRLAKCTAAVMNKTTVDAEVMRRVRKVTLDTSKGQSIALIEHMMEYPRGCEVKQLHHLTGKEDNKIRAHLRYMQALGMVDLSKAQVKAGVVSKSLWYVTPRLRKLYSDAMEE